MSKYIVLRVCVDILIAVCILQSWWLMALAIAIIATWIFPYFVEIIIAGFVFDALFGMVPSMKGWGYLSTIEAVVIFAAIQYIRSRVRR